MNFSVTLHNKNKKDAPSGTAKTIAEKLNITGFLPAVYLACGYRAGQRN